MKPFVKWAGGKRSILENIKKYIEEGLDGKHRYYEPFVGGGSVFFALKRNNCVINDLNEELIICYEVIKEQYKELIKQLEIHQTNHNETYYYQIREMDRDVLKYRDLSKVEKAARVIYLNKTCFNGLYRVNSKGFFNTPMGKYANPLICDTDNINALHEFLVESKTIIKNTSFENCVNDATKGDFLYFDPPYDYEDDKGFTQYVKEGFTESDLKKLKETCDILIDKGCKVLISNNATERVLRLFDCKHYNIVATGIHELESIETKTKSIYKAEEVGVRRNINSDGTKRDKVMEVLIYGQK